MPRRSMVSAACRQAPSTTLSVSFKKSRKLRVRVGTAWLLRQFLSLISRLAVKPAKLRSKLLSIPLVGWSRSGSRSLQQKALRSFAGSCSWIAKTRMPGTPFARASARCIRTIPATSRCRRGRWNTGREWFLAIPSTRRCLITSMKNGLLLSGFSAPVACCG